MPPLNKGRCARCILHRIYHNETAGKMRLFCLKYDNWCRNYGFICREPPMGALPSSEAVKDILKDN
jgi:hypothetical protein